MIPPKTFAMYWNNTKQIISKGAISGYFSKAQLLYSSVTLGDVHKEQSFPKLPHSTVKTIGLYSETWAVSQKPVDRFKRFASILPLLLKNVHCQADLYVPGLI